MHRSTYEAPIEAPSDDTVVLPDALNLPAYTAPTLADPAGEATVVVAPPMPPMPPMPRQPLPEAPPVTRVRAEKTFPIRNVTIVAAAVAVAGIAVALALSATLGSQPAPVAEEQPSVAVPSTSGLPGERGGPFVRRTAPPSIPPQPTPTEAAVPSPAPDAEPEPVREAPAAPPESASQTPLSSTPAPAAPVAPTAPAPLAFTGITDNRGENAFGNEVVMTRTLSMTGEPGSTASVQYGWLDAGTVTFDDDGTAALEIDRSTLLLMPGNTRISAEYSDGTDGDPIEVRRNDIAG